MAKKAYIGINNVARKVSKIYLGIDNVARKVKKAYIGIGGIARPWWGSETLSYYGVVTGGNIPHFDGAATSVGNYAVISGSSTTFAVSDSLTKSTAGNYISSNGDYGLQGLAATTVGDYAIFGGG